MTYTWPTPSEVGIEIPASLREDRFNEGFLHCLRGGQLDRREHFRLSFRMGFRAGKLYLRELGRTPGIIRFPHRMKLSAYGLSELLGARSVEREAPDHRPHFETFPAARIARMR